MDFGQWLRSQLEQRGMTMTQLASEVGVTQSAVSHWISGNRRPDATFAERIARALGLDTDDVLSRAGHTEVAPSRAETLRSRLARLQSQRETQRAHLATLERQIEELDREIIGLEGEVAELESASGVRYSIASNVSELQLLNLFELQDDRFTEEFEHRFYTEWTEDQRQAFLEGFRICREAAERRSRARGDA